MDTCEHAHVKQKHNWHALTYTICTHNTQKHTNTHTDKHTHRQTHTQTNTHTDKHTHRQIQAHTSTRKHTQAHASTRKHMQAHARTRTHTHTLGKLNFISTPFVIYCFKYINYSLFSKLLNYTWIMCHPHRYICLYKLYCIYTMNNDQLYFFNI